MPNRSFSSPDYRYGFNGQESDDEIKGVGNSYDFGNRMHDPRIGRFFKRDKYEQKFAFQSPYLFAGNTPVSGTDVNGDSLYILVYSPYTTDGMFRSAANTRKYDIEHSEGFNPEKDKVVILKMTDVSVIGESIEKAISDNKKYGPTVEFGVYSHAGLDGPVGTKEVSNTDVAIDDYQMTIDAWGAIDFNWSEDGNNRAGFYGCNTGKRPKNGLSFTYKLSKLDNFKDVSIYGQTTSTYPSIYADERNTDMWQVVGNYGNVEQKEGFSTWLYKTYMVGGNEGEGWSAISGVKANPMKVSKNGEVISRDFYQPGDRSTPKFE